MSWSCCFHVRNTWEGPKLKLVEETKRLLDRSCREGHGVEPSTNEKTPWPIWYGFICIRQNCNIPISRTNTLILKREKHGKLFSCIHTKFVEISAEILVESLLYQEVLSYRQVTYTMTMRWMQHVHDTAKASSRFSFMYYEVNI
jgi:hypothetical protein